MAEVAAVIEVDELKRYLGLGDGDHADDALLEQLERQELADFERRTNRYFGPVTELVDIVSVYGRRRGMGRYGEPGWRGSNSILLRAPIASVTSVELFGGVTFTGGSSWTTPWALSAFSTSDHRLYFLDGSIFPAGVRNVRVTYQGGYAAGTEPYDVRGAITQMVANRYRERHAATESKPAPPLTSRVDSVVAGWRRSPGL